MIIIINNYDNYNSNNNKDNDNDNDNDNNNNDDNNDNFDTNNNNIDDKNNILHCIIYQSCRTTVVCPKMTNLFVENWFVHST